jgi:prepilin-type N-terminal cleavage/methylation domain-containing protein
MPTTGVNVRRRGFSLIELVVVVALITLLGTLLVMAISHMQVNAKRQQTRLTLQNLQAMFAEYDANRRVQFGAGNLNPNLIPGLSASLCLQSPGNVTTDSTTGDRTGNAVQYTRYLMAQMMQSTNTAAAIGKLPSSALMTFAGATQTASRGPWVSGTIPGYSVYDSVSYTYLDPVSGAELTSVFVRSYLYTDPTGATVGVLPDGATQSPPNYYYWMPTFNSVAAAQAIPVVLDAWGNPIVFVMGGVLGEPSGSASGLLNAGGNVVQVSSPDYHPFFASAGPDGDFSKGDDNLYSFDK